MEVFTCILPIHGTSTCSLRKLFSTLLSSGQSIILYLMSTGSAPVDQTSSLVLVGSVRDNGMRADSEHWLHFLFSSEDLNCNNGICPWSTQTSLGWQNLAFTLWSGTFLFQFLYTYAFYPKMGYVWRLVKGNQTKLFNSLTAKRLPSEMPPP